MANPRVTAMSTVLWANVLTGSTVTSDQADRYALYKHADKLDAVCQSLGLSAFQEICDTTDLRYNTTSEELPEGMTSTTDVMAREGAWMDAGAAVGFLEQLLTHIRQQRVRFGLIRNDHDAVVQELTEVIEFLKGQQRAERFNFSVVM
jgi:hypothetical protein